jgi:hypothetical protein
MTHSYYSSQHVTPPGHAHSVMSPQPAQDLAQKKRPKYTRSKTGCLTCRVKKIKVCRICHSGMHVKVTHHLQCDEEKPICSRCSHSQRDVRVLPSILSYCRTLTQEPLSLLDSVRGRKGCLSAKNLRPRETRTNGQVPLALLECRKAPLHQHGIPHPRNVPYLSWDCRHLSPAAESMLPVPTLASFAPLIFDQFAQ